MSEPHMHSPARAALHAPDAVSRFLWSIGRRDESEFYLALFRAEAKERFAAIAVDATVVEHAKDTLVADLRFLSDLGLIPIVVLGVFDPGAAARQASALADGLVRADVAAAIATTSGEDGFATLAARVGADARAGVVPIVALDARAGATTADRLERLGAMIAELGTRKLIFLQRRGGITVEGRRIGIVELNADSATLMASADVSRKQRSILAGVSRLLDTLAHRCTFAVTSPLDLLRELFTTSGAGTLVRRAARVTRHLDYSTIDLERLRVLLESAFAKPLAPGFFERPVSRIYLEESYRGVAMVTENDLGAYMGKFAVERQAQGEGIGADVWRALTADYSTVFWRSRVTNPINAWYTKQCDGMAKVSVWQIFWRGVAPERIPEAMAFALEQPKDFPRI